MKQMYVIGFWGDMFPQDRSDEAKSATGFWQKWKWTLGGRGDQYFCWGRSCIMFRWVSRL